MLARVHPFARGGAGAGARASAAAGAAWGTGGGGHPPPRARRGSERRGSGRRGSGRRGSGRRGRGGAALGGSATLAHWGRLNWRRLRELEGSRRSGAGGDRDRAADVGSLPRSPIYLHPPTHEPPTHPTYRATYRATHHATHRAGTDRPGQLARRRAWPRSGHGARGAPRRGARPHTSRQIDLSAYTPTRPPTHSPTHPLTRPRTHLPTHPPTRPRTYPPTQLPAFLPIYLFHAGGRADPAATGRDRRARPCACRFRHPCGRVVHNRGAFSASAATA